MNRIDHHPPAGPNGMDGAQLQRRMLQDLERQWLDSWGAANAAQLEPASVSPDPQMATARSSTFSANDTAHNGLLSTAGASLPTPDRHAAGVSNAARAEGAPADRSALGRPTKREADREPTDPVDARVARQPEDGNFGEAPQHTALGLQAGFVGVWHSPPAVAAAVHMAPELALPIAIAPTAAVAPSLVLAAQAGMLASAPEAEQTGAPATRKSQPHTAAGDPGTSKLTLRELAPDLVQATLRDTQLDLPASQLAAQGLARALMEAGYGQVRVVVNGQHSRSERAEPDDDARPAELSSSRTDSSPETAPKDPAHGN